MSADSIKVVFNARDNTTAVTSKIKNANSEMAGSMKKDFLSLRPGILGAVASIGTLYATIRAVGSTIRTAFKFETIGTQFEILLGTAAKAKERMAELEEFSGATPFQMEGIAKASKLLDTFSGNLLGGVSYLRIYGDAAAATNQQIEDVSMWVGRAYSAIKSGRPFGEAAQRLQEMGIMTGETRQQLESLQAAGASNIEIWDLFQSSMDRFAGGMEKLSLAGDGLVSTLKDNVTLAINDLGKGADETAKGGLQALIDKIKELREGGDLREWSTSFVDGIKISVSAIKSLGDTKFGKLMKVEFDIVKNSLTTVGALGVGALGMASGMSFKESQAVGAEFAARRYTSDSTLRKLAVDQLGYDPVAQEAAQRADFLAGNQKTPEQIEKQKQEERAKVAAAMKAAEALKKDQSFFDELDKEYDKKAKLVKETTKKVADELEKRQKSIAALQERLADEEKKENNQAVIDALEKRIADATGRQAEAKEAMATAEEKRAAVANENIAAFIKGFQDKKIADAEKNEANQAAVDRVAKIEGKIDRGIGIGRNDREFLEAEKARRKELADQEFNINEAKRKLEEARADEVALADERKDFKKMNGTLEKIRDDLVAALRDPG